jgi:hypothetical protein
MSPTSTARHPSTLRRIALCAAALVVTVLPTACGAAYADSGYAHHGVVEVGGASAADPRGDDEEAAAEDGADQNADDQNAGQNEEQAGGEEAPAEEANAGENNAGENGAEDDPAAAQGEQNGQNNGQGNENNGQGNENNGQNNNGQNNDAQNNNGLDVLGTDCTNSELEPHDGFEKAPRCVDTSFGEVAAEDKSPSLLITEAPQSVAADAEFTISVSTRNLVRDRFLGAAAGGYYLESSFLNGDGIQRGHFHTACRMLESTNEAPDAAPAPEFFLATQDNGGGEGADTVQITVSGLPDAGTAQCAVWAGDGSHRIPMMQRANQTPAFDAVRITVE